MKKIIVFGNKDTASLARFYLENDANQVVEAFTVDDGYCDGVNYFEGLPLIPFSEVKNVFPPDKYWMFCPIIDNKVREKKFLESKNEGYSFYSFVHSTSIISTKLIGENCFILESNIIQPYVSIADNVVMWTCNHVGHHSVINSHVFLSSHVVICGHCTIGSYSWVGVNTSIKEYTTIAENTKIGMASAVTKNTTPDSLYYGLPAKQVR